MSLPQNGANGVFVQVYPLADLSQSATVPSSAADDGTVFHTLCPATVHIISKLTSGAGTIKIDRAATSAAISYGGADVSTTVSGTGEQSGGTLDTTASELYVGIQLASTTATAVWNQLCILVLYRLPDDILVQEVRSKAINMISAATTTNAGSGVVVRTFA